MAKKTCSSNRLIPYVKGAHNSPYFKHSKYKYTLWLAFLEDEECDCILQSGFLRWSDHFSGESDDFSQIKPTSYIPAKSDLVIINNIDYGTVAAIGKFMNINKPSENDSCPYSADIAWYAGRDMEAPFELEQETEGLVLVKREIDLRRIHPFVDEMIHNRD